MSFTTTQRPATQAEILTAMALLLQEEFSDWDAAAIYWTDTETPEVDTNLSKFITIHAGGGGFDANLLDGNPIVKEDCQIGVKIHRRSEVDTKGQSEESLFRASEGLLALKRRVLKALSGKMLYDPDGIQIATSTVHPLRAGDPVEGEDENPLDSLAIVFGVNFEWNLS